MTNSPWWQAPQQASDPVMPSIDATTASSMARSPWWRAPQQVSDPVKPSIDRCHEARSMASYFTGPKSPVARLVPIDANMVSLTLPLLQAKHHQHVTLARILTDSSNAAAVALGHYCGQQCHNRCTNQVFVEMPGCPHWHSGVWAWCSWLFISLDGV